MSILERLSESCVDVVKKAKPGQDVSANAKPALHQGYDTAEPPADYAAKGNILASICNFRINLGPSKKDVLNFTNQLSIMIKAGISINEALESIASQTVNIKFKQIISGINHDIKAGQSFSEAISKHQDVFSNLYVNMIAAAEVSGSLSLMLSKLAGYLDQEAETRSQVRSAMIYPVIIATMAVVVTIFLLTFVLPRFTAIFEGKEHLLPAPTKMIMAASAFLRGYWFLLLLAVPMAFWGLWHFVKTSVGRFWWDKAKLKIPLSRQLCRSLYITRGLHTMGVLTNAGVPILDTILITSQVCGNVHYRQMWRNVHNSVRQGHKIAHSLTNCSLLPSSVVQMIQSGESSGRLSEVLTDVSSFYARQLKAVIKNVTSMIEPIMIVLMGVMVGFIAMSIILPIFKMSSLVSGH